MRQFENLAQQSSSQHSSSQVLSPEEDAKPNTFYHLPPRTLLDGRYLLGKSMSQTPIGINYQAWSEELQKKVAIFEYFPQALVTRYPRKAKVILFKEPKYSPFSRGVDWFLEEARALAKATKSPNLSTVHDYFRGNGTAYMVYDYLEAPTIQDILDSHSGNLSFNQLQQIIEPLLRALNILHGRGLIHCNLHPLTIRFPNNKGLILTEYGMAWQRRYEELRQQPLVLNENYAAPEQNRRNVKFGPWTDIYGAGAIIYHLLTGVAPPLAAVRMESDELIAPSSMGINIPQRAEKALLTALHLKSEKRYRNIEKFREAFLTKEITPTTTTTSTSSSSPSRVPFYSTGAEVVEKQAVKENIKLKIE